MNGAYLLNQLNKSTRRATPNSERFVGAKSELNPSLNSVAEAFKRRQLLWAFATDNQEISLDALLHSDSVSLDDNDLSAPDIKQISNTNRTRQTNS